MRRVNIKGLAVVALGVVLVAAGSSLFASNMGFKLNSLLRGTTTAGSSGEQYLALPFNRQLGLDFAAQVSDDINAAFGGDTVVSIARLDPFAGTITYATAGTDPNGFALEFAEALIVTLEFDTNYIVVGSHKPGQAITFPGTGSGAGGNLYAHAYHSTKSTAAELANEIDTQFGGSTVVAVARLDPFLGTQTYATAGTDPNGFPLTPGEGLFVLCSDDVTWTPSHY